MCILSMSPNITSFQHCFYSNLSLKKLLPSFPSNVKKYEKLHSFLPIFLKYSTTQKTCNIFLHLYIHHDHVKKNIAHCLSLQKWISLKTVLYSQLDTPTELSSMNKENIRLPSLLRRQLFTQQSCSPVKLLSLLERVQGNPVVFLGGIQEV